MSKPTVVLVCGGRHYSVASRVRRELGKLVGEFGTLAIVTGGADGADALAHAYALSQGWDVVTVHAAWGHHGKRAGPIRNAAMLRLLKPKLVLAFPGGRGTANMIEQARDAGVEVREV